MLDTDEPNSDHKWHEYLPYDNMYQLQGCCFKTRPNWRDMKGS